MQGEKRGTRIMNRVTMVFLLACGFYLVLGAFLLPEALWDPLADRIGDTRLLGLLLGVLFVYFAALTREKERLRLVTGEIIEGLNRALYGPDYRAHREAVDTLLVSLRSTNADVRETAIKSLRRITGVDRGDDLEAWSQWWKDNRRTFRIASASSSSVEARSPEGAER